MTKKRTWQKARHKGNSYKGVEYREHLSRKHGVMRDRYYRIRYQHLGKTITSGLGWASEGWTPTEASRKRGEYISNAKAGQMPTTMAEEEALRQAEKEQREHEARLEKIKGITFSDFWMEHYLPRANGDKKPRTMKAEISIYETWINKAIGSKPLVDIAPIHLEGIKRKMTRAGRAPRTIHYMLQIIRQVFNTAIDLEFFAGVNPVSKVKRPKYNNKRLRFLSHDEADQLLTALKERSRTTHDMAVLSLHCGLRAGEVMALTWGDVDLEHGLLNLRDTKNKESRTVHITEAVKNILTRMKQGGKSEIVFPDTRHGGAKQYISKAFDKTVQALGFNEGVTDRRQRVTFHALRHTFASWTVMAGVEIYTLQKILGHSSIAMTERYSHLAPGKYKKAAEIFQQGLNQSKAGKVVSLR